MLAISYRTTGRTVRMAIGPRLLRMAIVMVCVLMPAARGETLDADYTVEASSVARGDWFMVTVEGETEFFSLFDVECAPVAHPLGKEAKKFVRAVIAGAAVGLTVVERRTPALARVAASLDGLSLSAILVSEGLAVIRPGVQAPEELIAERDRARSLRLGFWSDYGAALEALRGMNGQHGELIEELERLHADEVLEERKGQIARLKEIQRVISDSDWRKVTTRVAGILSPGEFRGVALAYPSPSLENVRYYIEALGDWELGPAFSFEPSPEPSSAVVVRSPESAAILAARIENNLARLRANGRAKNEAKRLALETQARAASEFFDQINARPTFTGPFATRTAWWGGPQNHLIVNGQWMPPWSQVFIITPRTGHNDRRHRKSVNTRTRHDGERRSRGS